MQKKIRPIIHVGYPKAASTWLQQVLFKNKDAGFLAPWGMRSNGAITQLAVKDKFLSESAQRVFHKGLQEAVKSSLVPVLSHENMSGNPARNQYWGKEVANRIHAIFPEALILIVIREQKSILRSWYKYHIKCGGKRSLDQFINAKTVMSEGKIFRLLEHFEYDLLIGYYQSIFGLNNVLVLPFELLKISKESFVKKIFGFADLNNSIDCIDYTEPPKNVSCKAGRVVLQRQMNYLIQPCNKLPWLVSSKLSAEIERFIPQAIHTRIEKRWQQSIEEQVGDLFHASNQRTSELIKMNLADFGYD